MESRVDVKIGFNCNNRCKFCVQGEKRFKLPEKSKNKVLEELRDGRSRGANSVVFTGGEPTINKNIMTYVSYAKKIGYETIQIQSNGRMFSYMSFCKNIVSSGANQFSPALHGSKPEIHDSLVGAKGAFSQVIEGIKNLKKLKQEIIVNIVVNRQNYKDLPNIANLLVSLGVDQYQFAFVHIVGTAWKNKDTIVPSVKKTMPYIKEGLDIGIKNNVKVMTEAIPYCLMSGYEEYIAEKIIPESAVFDAGFIIDDYSKYRRERGKIKAKKCKKCKYYKICEGPWREYPELMGWEEFVPVVESKSDKVRNKFSFYKNYLKKLHPTYNNFFLANLLVWFGDSEKINALSIRKKWNDFFKKNKKEHVLNFYVHIPFCESRCSYCMYYSRKGDKKSIDKYIKNIESQIEFFKGTFKGKYFSSLYFGGGTPSILNNLQLEKILKSLFASFDFKGGERTFECNPRTTTFSKLKLLRKYGFNRISFGVQNFDKDVLKYANRERQTYDLIKKVIADAKKLNFEVNADLMIGLVGDSVEKIIDSFEILSNLKPDTIALYPLKPSDVYLKNFYKNNNNNFLKELDQKATKVREIIKKNSDKFSYFTQNSDNEIFTSAEPTFYIKGFRENYESSYDYTSPLNYNNPCSLFALGTSGSSYIYNKVQYHITEDVNDEELFSSKKNNYWAMDFDEKKEKVYFVLQNLANKKSISFKEFNNFFGSDFKKIFNKEINEFKFLKQVEIKKDSIVFPTDALDRYAAAMFFLDDKKIIKKINEKKERE